MRKEEMRLTRFFLQSLLREPGKEDAARILILSRWPTETFFR
jgi:hypothetical protein